MGAVGDALADFGTEVGEVIKGGLDSLQALTSLPGQVASGAGGVFDFAKYVPWVLFGVLILALIFIIRNPSFLKAFV